ncbi:MAG TPA: hypothetical protein VH206_00280 [Xanthobacteraceae bacterium]|jgi:hypothetical protein|nr:hypothetical protein [Xanthobacteraceae bacterium]
MAAPESPEAKLPVHDISPAVRMAGKILRILFICTLLALAVRVSLPQSETIWTAYETPADLIRFLLGLAMCLWLGFQLLHGPTDAHSYRTWFYLGLAAVPFAMICLFAVW